MDYPEPIGFYASSPNNPLLFHILNVAEGLMILVIFPDKTTMLYDCNVVQEDKDWIIKYLGEHIPWRYDPEIKDVGQCINIFVNSHRDQDHYRGLSEINTQYQIKSIWDSGESGETTLDDDYKYYMGLRRTLLKKYGKDAVRIPIPSYRLVAAFGSVGVYCLNSSEEFNDKQYFEEFEKSMLKAVKIQHTNSVVLSLRYAGRSVLLPSDSDWKAWKEKIIPNFKRSGLLKSDILVASHHGSRSFFTDEENEHIDPEENPETTYIESIGHIKPSITLISCGEYSHFHHPNREAEQIYKENTAYEQVYTTDQKGSFVGFIDSYGNWTAAPTRFRNNSNKDVSFNIQCIMSHNDKKVNAKSGMNFPIGCNVQFSIIAHGGLLDPYDSVDVIWEVSNGGISNDHEHQDIYYKNEKDRGDKCEFYREVKYEGKHLLRCKVKNRKKNLSVTRIFIVNGIHV